MSTYTTDSFLSDLETKLRNELPATHVAITDNSWMHAGHVGNTHGGSHLALTIVSLGFEGLSTLKRHRMVHALLAEEMQQRIHALELKLLTPTEADRS